MKSPPTTTTASHAPPQDKTRRLGQVFTPPPVADWMVRWACRPASQRILDPAVGNGVFINAIEALPGARGRSQTPRIDVCDIDGDMLAGFDAAPRRVNVRCRRTDFVTAAFRRRYDAIIANPPYIRHHAMRYDDAILRKFDRICRRRLSRMTNLYGLFLIKIWTLLADGGRAAVITPAEWLNADFGVPIKGYLLEENAIDTIVHFDHAANVFGGVLTTAAITLLRRGRAKREPIRLRTVRDVAALASADPDAGRAVAPADIDPAVKWTPLFTASKAAAPVDQPTLGDIAACTRGIATGANDYFTLRESDRCRWKIDDRDLRVCITKAQQITGSTLTNADVQRLVKADQRIYLLSPQPRLTAAVQRYLDEGRRRHIDERYLPSHRPVWYRPEHREPAPLLVSVFTRGAFRFVWNKAGAKNLTAYHAITPRDPSPKNIRALFAYLTSSAAQTAIGPHTRIYADGLFKLEPRDVEALPIPPELFRLCQAPAAKRRCHRSVRPPPGPGHAQP